MPLTDELLDTPAQPAPVPRRGVEGPGHVEWDGTSGTLSTPVLAERPTTWDAYIREAGVDPETVTVVEPVSVRGWQVQPAGGGELVWAHYYRLNLASRRPGPAVDELVAIVKRKRATKRPAESAADAPPLVIALGDLQLGKMDGDGVAGTVERTTQGLADAAAIARRHRGPVHLAWLGDCVEGYTSQGGANAWRTTLTMTEQLRLFRRLIMHAVEVLAPVTDELTVAAVPGNHGDPQRLGGKGVTRFDDSHDTEALVSVADALALRPDVYGHVRCFTPAPDETTVTVEVGGTVIGHAHGHYWRQGKHFEWLAGQALGDHAVGRADLMLAGHNHHLVLQQQSRRTFVQVPALESESTWWRHRTGQTGRPGIVTLVSRAGSVEQLTIV